MYYCNLKNKGCYLANQFGYCAQTACTNHEDDEYVNYVSYYPNTGIRGNNCEICGQTTEDSNYYICAKCRSKLYDLIYHDDNWGIG